MKNLLVESAILDYCRESKVFKDTDILNATMEFKVSTKLLQVAENNKNQTPEYIKEQVKANLSLIMSRRAL